MAVSIARSFIIANGTFRVRYKLKRSGESIYFFKLDLPSSALLLKGSEHTYLFDLTDINKLTSINEK